MVSAKDVLKWKEFVAEMLGTFILTLVGKSAAVSLASNENPGIAHGLGCVAAGLGVMIGILVTGKSSGAHVNPQVSVAFALTGDLAPLSLPAYLLGQFLGAGAAALVVLLLYQDTLFFSSHITTETALAALASSPGVAQSTSSLIFDQVIASCLLQLVNACVKEQGHQPGGLLVGCSVIGLSLAFGPIAGAAMNPAADFMPRLVSYLAGNGKAFSHLDLGSLGSLPFWTLPFLLPYLGGALAGMLYKYGIVQLGGRGKLQADDV